MDEPQKTWLRFYNQGYNAALSMMEMLIKDGDHLTKEQKLNELKKLYKKENNE